MAVTPEVLKPEAGIKEKTEEFIVPETLQQATGIKVVQKNFTAQVKDGKGTPIIQTTPAQVITVSPPAPAITLTSWAEGPITSSVTWLGMFWLRIIKKAMFYGWRIVTGENKN